MYSEVQFIIVIKIKLIIIIYKRARLIILSRLYRGDDRCSSTYIIEGI